MSVSNIDSAERLELKIGALLESIEALEEYLPDVPDANCRCHLSPPCNDCVDWSRLREALETISEIRKECSQ